MADGRVTGNFPNPAEKTENMTENIIHLLLLGKCNRIAEYNIIYNIKKLLNVVVETASNIFL